MLFQKKSTVVECLDNLQTKLSTGFTGAATVLPQRLTNCELDKQERDVADSHYKCFWVKAHPG